MKAYALFHLNINYSSIDSDQHSELLERCYWPFLGFVKESPGPITLEASGNSLEKVKALDPLWLAEAQRLVANSQLDIVTGGYEQIIGPLVPAEVNLMNLRRGQAVLKKYFGSPARTVLPSEQAFSQSLIPLYVDAGFSSVVVDFDNFKTGFFPAPAGQYASFAERDVNIVWSSSIAYQRFQHAAHGEISLEDFIERTEFDSKRLWSASAFPIYSGDLEVFGFRPGRYRSERALGNDEWRQAGDVLREALQVSGSQLFGVNSLSEPISASDRSGLVLRGLTSASSPTIVKKQPKYNLSRWAVSGRDDFGLNAMALRFLHRASENKAVDEAAVLDFFASDYRTHITQVRWEELVSRLSPQPASTPKVLDQQRPVTSFESDVQWKEESGYVQLENSSMRVTLNTRRGLSIAKLELTKDSDAGPRIGAIPHGELSRIELTPDWFSGNLVIQPVGDDQITDLGPVEAETEPLDDGVKVKAEVATKIGSLKKEIFLAASGNEVTVLHQLPAHRFRGSVRLGFVSAFVDRDRIGETWFETHAGGVEPERFALPDTDFDMGTPLSLNRSCNTIIPISQGKLRLGLASRTYRIEFDPSHNPFAGLLAIHHTEEGMLVRFCLTAREVDETSVESNLPQQALSYTLAIDEGPSASGE